MPRVRVLQSIECITFKRRVMRSNSGCSAFDQGPQQASCSTCVAPRLLSLDIVDCTERCGSNDRNTSNHLINLFQATSGSTAIVCRDWCSHSLLRLPFLLTGIIHSTQRSLIRATSLVWFGHTYKRHRVYRFLCGQECDGSNRSVCPLHNFRARLSAAHYYILN